LSVKLRPCEHESLLTPRERTSHALDLANVINSNVLLIVRVKMRRVVLSSASTNIRMIIPKISKSLALPVQFMGHITAWRYSAPSEAPL
jgi:hypothetical protein